MHQPWAGFLCSDFSPIVRFTRIVSLKKTGARKAHSFRPTKAAVAILGSIFSTWRPVATEVTSMPCATRLPNTDSDARTSSMWNQLKSPDTPQKFTTSASVIAVSYTHLRAHETDSYLVCRLLLEKKKKNK